jgi:hypothetical protein
MEDYAKAAEVKDIPPSTMKAVEVNGKKVCLPMSKWVHHILFFHLIPL